MRLRTKTLALLSVFACGAAATLGAGARASAKPAAGPASSATAAVTAGSSIVTAVHAVELVVRDIDRSKVFFELLGFTSLQEEELSGVAAERRTGIAGARVKRLALSLGSEQIALLQYLTPSNGRSVPRDSRGNDLWFQHIAIVVRDMDRAYAWLRAQRVAHVSSGPQTLPRWNRTAGGIQAFYFADPDGHTLEIIRFPKGKGDPRWQSPTNCARTPVELCLFLGIDHTAITVEDTDQALAFYRDRLGLRVAGESENYGTEQEHLNGVFGARLRITALRAAAGPGIELLEYLSPRGGRPMPADVRANDLFHWQVVLDATNTSSVRAAALATGGRSVVQALSPHEALVRDRDGHALFLRNTPHASER
jgi:catechol 2,3-dioxygenase-like lactoylglutathione lyase family enzyme